MYKWKCYQNWVKLPSVVWEIWCRPPVATSFDLSRNQYVAGRVHTSLNFGEISSNNYEDILFTLFSGPLLAVTLTFNLLIPKATITSLRHTRALCQNQTVHCRYFYTTRKSNHSSFLTPIVVGG